MNFDHLRVSPLGPMTPPAKLGCLWGRTAQFEGTVLYDHRACMVCHQVSARNQKLGTESFQKLKGVPYVVIGKIVCARFILRGYGEQDRDQLPCLGPGWDYA